jgi:D-arginine dehydrogenase
VDQRFDFLVVGGGIGGVSAGYELARDGRVCVLEQEDQLAVHATGRSAAIFMETYGNGPVRALTRASRDFYAAPPGGFSEEPLTSRRGALFLADAAHLQELEEHFRAVRELVPSVEWVEREALASHVPCLAADRWVAALLEPGAVDLDVHAIHQGYVRGLRGRGGVVLTGAAVRGIARRDGRWFVSGLAGELSAPVLVNAAGAWADALARLAGVPPIGLQPLRRTLIVIDAPGDVSAWPLVSTVDGEFYFKPDARRLLVSPCDETPSDPCNAAADDYDVALAVDRLERATTLRVQHVPHRWAGLRSFVADRTPVAGPDPEVEGFVWLAAQGGYGIQTAPALARACRGLWAGEGIPPDLAAFGLTAEALGPRRPGLRPA